MNCSGITPQAARMFIPLLQQIASSDSLSPELENNAAEPEDRVESGNGTETRCVPLNEGPLSTLDKGVSTNSIKKRNFSCSEMFMSKKKNSRSSEAHSYLHYVVREAAKAAGIWNSAPLLDEIPPEVMKKFRDMANSICPDLQYESLCLRHALGKCLMNRRAYLRKLKLKPPAIKWIKRKSKSKSYKYGPKSSQSMATAEKLLTGSNTKNFPFNDCRDNSVSALTSGQNVIIRDNKENKLGDGVFVCKVNAMYGKVLLMKNICKDDIDLPKALASKTMFKDLKRNDVFEWKLERLQIQLDPLPNPEINPDHDKVHRESTSSVPTEDYDESDNYNEYEERRRQSIRRNREVFQEIDNGNISINSKGQLSFSKDLPHHLKQQLMPNEETNDDSDKQSKDVSSTEISKNPMKKKVKSRSKAKRYKESKFWKYISDDDDSCDLYQQPSADELASSGRGMRMKRRKIKE